MVLGIREKKVCSSLLVLLSTIFLLSCDAKTPQASYSSCLFTWGVFEENIGKAHNSSGTDKIYYAQLADMNVSLLLGKGCCKYNDTCPAAVLDK